MSGKKKQVLKEAYVIDPREYVVQRGNGTESLDEYIKDAARTDRVIDFLNRLNSVESRMRDIKEVDGKRFFWMFGLSIGLFFAAIILLVIVLFQLEGLL